MSGHDIIDNRERKLGEVAGQMLENSEGAKFAVGYFFLSGFEGIREHLGRVKELRLLIGNTTTRETIEQMAEGYKRLGLVERAGEQNLFKARGERIRAAEETAGNLRESMELMGQSDGEEETIRTLAGLIEEGRVKVRVYTKGRLHSKAYIFDYGDAERYEKGIAVVGSSNLTLAGLADNTELNVVVQGNENHEQLTRWFEGLWNDSEEFDEFLLRELKQSWAMNVVRPYDIYIKTLYNLVKDRIEGLERTELLWERDMPALANFQEDAVKQAIRILKEYHGVFIADVVGLGKSYIGAGLLKHFREYENKRGLIICPKALVNWWERLRVKYYLDAPVLSMSRLREGEIDLEEDYADRELVLIDESHHFRHSNIQRYRALELYLQGKRDVILLTATPLNTDPRDILRQIELFYRPDRAPLPVDPPDLRRYFTLIRGGERKFPELLRHILIRRPRSHIERFYPDAKIDGKPVVFPERVLETKTYGIDQVYGGVYDRIRALLEQLELARYGLWWYVKAEKQGKRPYDELHSAGRNLKGLIRVMVFKRFESSVEAFRRTLGKLAGMHEGFLEGLERGVVAAGEEAQRLLYDTDLEEEVEIEAFFEELKEKSANYKFEDFEVEKLKRDVASDKEVLEEALSLVEAITPEQDDKLQTLIRLLDGPLARARKVLIFSQFADTVDYLYENLRERPATQKIDGSTSNQEGIIRRFAPRANPPGLRRGEHEIRLLISSDVLSEGLNLQDCDHIINYDLHWNPVRLIQRIGRIDRIGSEHAEVYAFNFLPETGLEKHLGLEDKLTRRIEEIHRVIGGDPQILHPTEQPNDDALYAIYRGGSEALEGYEEVEDLTISEVEGIVRQIQKEKPEYFEYIRSLPDGVRSAKAAESRGYFAFLQAGGYQQLALLDPGGKVVSRDLQEGLRAIRCEETEPARDIPREMNRMISGAKSRFDREVEQREAQREHARSLSLGQRYVLDQVRIIYSGTEDERLKHSIEVLERAFRSQVPLAVERRLNSLRRNHATGEPLVDRLAEIYRYFDLHTLLEAEKAPQVDRTIPRIVSSEALL